MPRARTLRDVLRMGCSHRAHRGPAGMAAAMTIAYSRGTSKTDNHPRPMTAPDFAAFVAALDADRAPRKGLGYICGPLNGAGRRCAEGALPRRWLPLDLDRIAPDALPEVRLWFARFSGCAWPTHSSTPDAPRERVILELDREASRDECIAIGAALARDLNEEFGEAIELDPSTCQTEQANYCPPVGVTLARFDGEPLAVDRYLAAAQKARADAPERPQRRERAEDERRISEGGRNAALTRFAGSLRRVGLSATEIAAALQQINRERCAPPLADGEVRTIAQSVGRYENGEAPQAPPLDIFRELAAPPLDAADFPPLLADYALPLARAAGHDPTAYLMAGLGAAAGAMGDDVRLLLDSTTSWVESARLWVLLLGAPGTAKTPAVRAAMAPLFDLHRELRARHAREVAALTADDPRPPLPAVFVSDATVEKLSEVLADNPRGIVAVFEELDTWLGAHDAYRGGQGAKDRGEWLRLFDGGPHQVDRIKRGSYFVANWGASILGATTPAGLRRHAKELPPDGLIQRFLPAIVRPMVAPDASIRTADVRRAREAFEARLRELHGAPASVVKLSREAFALFDARRAALREEVQAVAAMSEAFAAHLAKHAGLLGRVALTMHGLEHGADSAGVDLAGATMARADRLLRKLARHALAVFDMLDSGDSVAPLAQAAARSIVAGKLAEVTRRDLRQHCRAFKNATEYQREAAIRLLIDAAWLTPIDTGRQYDGRPARLTVAPEVFERFAAQGEALHRRRAAVRELFESK